jgi:hypothetical protein
MVVYNKCRFKLKGHSVQPHFHCLCLQEEEHIEGREKRAFEVEGINKMEEEKKRRIKSKKYKC